MCLIMTTEGWKQLGDAVVCTNHNNVEGVYRPSPLDKILMAGRIDRFLAANSLNLMEKQRYFRGDHFNEPLYGAFGEKL